MWDNDYYVSNVFGVYFWILLIGKGFYLVDCICLVVSESSKIFTIGSVSDWSCFNWATTSVLFSFKADTKRNKEVNIVLTFAYDQEANYHISLDGNLWRVQ